VHATVTVTTRHQQLLYRVQEHMMTRDPQPLQPITSALHPAMLHCHRFANLPSDRLTIQQSDTRNSPQNLCLLETAPGFQSWEVKIKWLSIYRRYPLPSTVQKSSNLQESHKSSSSGPPEPPPPAAAPAACARHAFCCWWY